MLDSLPSTDSRRQDILALLNATIQRYGQACGREAALRVAQRVPHLATDADGQVVAFDEQDPLATLSALISEFEAAFPYQPQAPGPAIAALAGRPATPARVRILLVDDHVLFRSGLNSVIAPHPDFVVVGHAESVREAVALAQSAAPDIVLMDFTLADGTGVDATQAILALNPDIKVIFLTIHEDDTRLTAAIRAGAMGYLLKNIRATELIERLRAVARGEPAFSAAMAMRILKELRGSQPNQPLLAGLAVDLTAREIEIMQELSRGATNREIAAKLVISENTVKNHVRNVLGKLHLSSRRDVALYARAHGLPPGLNKNSQA